MAGMAETAGPTAAAAAEAEATRKRVYHRATKQCCHNQTVRAVGRVGVIQVVQENRGGRQGQNPKDHRPRHQMNQLNGEIPWNPLIHFQKAAMQLHRPMVLEMVLTMVLGGLTMVSVLPCNSHSNSHSHSNPQLTATRSLLLREDYQVQQ